MLSRFLACSSVAFLRETWLSGAEAIPCQPIVATGRADGFCLPWTIKRWSHEEVGIICGMTIFRGQRGLVTPFVDVKVADEYAVAKELYGRVSFRGLRYLIWFRWHTLF